MGSSASRVVNFVPPYLFFIYLRVCPAPSLEGNSPYGPVAHGVPQANPENGGSLWQFDLTCVGKPSGKPHTEGLPSRGIETTTSRMEA